MEASIKQCAYCGAESKGSKYCCQACESLHDHIEITGPKLSEHSELDLPNIRIGFLHTAGPFDFKLHVEGLHCASCIHLIERLPEFDSTVTEARVDFASSLLALKTTSDFSLARLIDLLESWGYRAHFLAENENSLNKIREENKNLLKKLAITGACAGNIMLFVIPIYSGLDGAWKTAFNWMSFALFLPVVFYSGTQFYQGAWNSLRYRTINVDLPIAIALLSGFILSTINLIRGNGAIYFDSTAGFIFLILCARYYLKKTQQKFLGSQNAGNEILNDQYRLFAGNKEKVVAAMDIQVGDQIRLRKGQVCPIDGVIQSPGLIDLAVMNGEPLPRKFEFGMKILAGSKVLSESIDVSVTAPYGSTYLSSLLRELREGELAKSNFSSMTDRAAQWLIAIVSGTALLYFALNYSKDFQEAFNRSLALIVLACPCALAFGAPLTLNLALRKAQSLGILIKESATLERLWRIQNIFFDKTGTLTSLNLKVNRTEPQEIPEEIKSVILGLERSSYHPIAFAIRDFWQTAAPAMLSDLEEKVGVGVTGKLQGVHYELIQNFDDSKSNDLSVALYKEGSKVCSIFLEAPIYPEAQATIAQLESQGIHCHLASGDMPSKVHFIGKLCGISSDKIYGGLNPHAKRNLVTSFANTCMIGDGSNDALALQGASVGIAVKGSTYLNLQAADIYFTREGLKSVLDLLSLSQRTKKVLIRNLLFALVYNIGGGALALLGHVDPWLAAVLMPASSVLIISSTLWGFR